MANKARKAEKLEHTIQLLKTPTDRYYRLMWSLADADLDLHSRVAPWFTIIQIKCDEYYLVQSFLSKQAADYNVSHPTKAVTRFNQEQIIEFVQNLFDFAYDQPSYNQRREFVARYHNYNNLSKAHPYMDRFDIVSADVDWTSVSQRWQQVVQQSQRLRDVLQDYDDCLDKWMPPEPLTEVCEAMVNVLTPDSIQCNREGCTKKDKLLKCGRCRQRYYCSKEHQKEDWRVTHKVACSVLQEMILG